MIVLGVDCGLDGAICGFDDANQRVDIIDMPTLAITRGGKNRREVDAVELARLLDEFCGRCTVSLAVIEEAQTVRAPVGKDGAPKWQTSVPSIAQAWRNYGVVVGVIASQFVPTEIVPPVTWKRAMGVLKPSDATKAEGKDASRAAASRIAPAYAHLWSRKRDDGRAEALLIAVYASRLFKKREAGL